MGELPGQPRRLSLRSAQQGSKQKSGGELPAFFFHFPVGPVLELFEERGFDDREPDADPAFVAHPHKASLRLEEVFAFGKDEAYIEKSGEAERFVKAVQSHPPGAEVNPINADLVAFGIPQGDGKLNAGPKKLLLLGTDEA